jgi:DUF1009 family protein
MAEAGLRALAVEAGRTILMGGPDLAAHADALDIAVVGIDPAAARNVS